ncbi:MAG: hypothetical protein AB7I19_05940 [Planctomycetota bacterium]
MCSIFALAVCLAPARAQAVSRAIDAPSLGIRLIAPIGGPSGRTVAIDFPAAGDREVFERLPLARPVSDVQIAPDGRGAFLVLAGGVAEDLDLYRFDPLRRSIDRFPTSGGRRLPDSFANGLGSWPVESGAGLYLFAFERDGEIRFRAQTSQRVVAERRLPIECVGFTASFDAVSHLVAVRFDGPIDAPLGRMEFLHPRAPRLGLVGARDRRIDFGELALHANASRTIELRNDGEHPLPLTLSLEGPFLAAERLPLPCEIPPDGVRSLEIAYEATAVGDARGRLIVQSPVAGSSLELALVATVAPPRPPRSDDASATAPIQVKRTENPAGDRSTGVGGASVVPDRSAPPLPAPRLDPARGPRFRWLDGNRVRVDVRLVAEGDAKPVLFRNERTGMVVATRIGAGATHASAVLTARAGDPLTIAFAANGSPGAIGTAPSALRVEGGELVVIAPPGERFLLLRVSREGGRPMLAGRGLLRRGRVGPDGTLRIAADSVADATTTTQVALVLTDSSAPIGAASARVAASVELGPSQAPIYRDRAK